MSEFATAYARHYDLLYADKDYAGEANYVHGLLERWAAGGTRLMELGSGTGRHAGLLAGKGYSVHGIERSAGMLVVAQQMAATNCTFSLGDLRKARLGQTFDAVLALFHVFGYQTSNADLAAAFATARAHLDPGGLLLFDYWYGPAVLSEKPAVRVKRVADAAVEVTRLAEPELRAEHNVVAVNYQMFVRDKATGAVAESCEQHNIRYMFLPELQLLLESQGFTLEHSEQWMTGRPLGLDTWYGTSLARAV